MIFCVNLWRVTFLKNFANNFLQKDIVSESSRQLRDVSKNIDGSFLNSPPQFLSVIHQYLVKVPLLISLKSRTILVLI